MAQAGPCPQNSDSLLPPLPVRVTCALAVFAFTGRVAFSCAWLLFHMCPAARVVKREPSLLFQDANTLQRKWDALTLPSAPGGVGTAFSTEQAREAVCKHPQLLGYSVET